MLIKYKKMIKTIFIACLMVLMFSGSPVHANRSLEIQQVNIQAEIFSDGTMAVQETRTIRFNGQYNGFFQNLRMDPGVKITDVQVFEEDTPFTYNPGSDYGPPGTYLVRPEDNNLHVDWSIDAYNETRTYLLSYVVHNQVMLHDDVAEINYQFIGDETEVPQSNISITLKLPESSSLEDLRAWGHGPLDGNVILVNHREVNWTLDQLPPRTFLEGRVVFSPNSILNPDLQTGKIALESILSEEQSLADQANRWRMLNRADWIAAPLILLGTLVTSFVFRRRYSKPFPTNFRGDYYRELPQKYSPAELGVLIRNNKPNSTDFTATVIDLAHRGFIRLEQQSIDHSGFLKRFKKDQFTFIATLQPHDAPLKTPEKSVLDFLFKEVSTDGKEVAFDEIESFAKKNPTHFKGFWDMWIEYVKLTADEHRFFDDTNKKPILKGVLISFMLIVIGIIAALVVSLRISAFALVLSGILAIVVFGTIRRRSPNGEEDYVRWMAFKKFLLHFSEMKRHELPSLIIWEHYMVYAITLGVAKEVIKQLQVVYPNMTENNRPFGYGWYYYGLHATHATTSLGNSFEGLTNNINHSITTALSSISSGSGKGGGFSGGGGFGGGGGGVGGR